MEKIGHGIDEDPAMTIPAKRLFEDLRVNPDVAEFPAEIAAW
jgi:hypothetical protein